MQSIAAVLFACAVVHTFSTRLFERLAQRHPRHAGLFHLLGEVEIVFGFWAFVLVSVMALVEGSAAAVEYAESRQYTEPLFVFVIMLIGPESTSIPGRAWIGPSILGLLLLAELGWAVAQGPLPGNPAAEVGPKQVAMSLFGPYVLGAEIAAFLLLAGLVGAFHLGRRRK